MSKNINKTQLSVSLNTIKDIFIYANEIIKAVEGSPDSDPICEIRVNENRSILNSNYHEGIDNTPYKSKQNCEPKHVISGSKAVTTFLELLRQGQKKAVSDGVKGCGPFLKLADYYKATDTDIFFLNSGEISRLKYGEIDIVHLKTPTITEHLEDFDLSCCKTSMSIDGKDFWISLHCLYTMLTGNCFIPKYLESPDRFRNFYNNTNNISRRKDIESFYESKTTDKCTMMFTRISQRLQKYKERGYTFQYFETDKALSWITSNNMDSYMDGY